MKRLARWIGYGTAAIAGLFLLGLGGVFAASTYMLRPLQAKPERLVRPSAALLADAPRQARVLGCASCHGEGLRGHLMFEVPHVGRIVAPNLTEVAAQASDQQLAAAIRQGVGHDGRPLFIMPSPAYSRLSDGEVAALIAYIRSLPRRPGATDARTIGPVGRLGVLTGKFRPAPALVAEYRTRRPADLGPSHAAGRRLAEHICADCHGPALQGQPFQDIVAPDLAVAAAYDYDQFRTLMRTGIPVGGRKLKVMDEVARKDFSNSTDDELKALHLYLKARAERQEN